MCTKGKIRANGIAWGCLLAPLLAGCGGSGTPPSLVTVSVSSPSATVVAGTSMQFVATVTNDPVNRGVTWTITCSAATSACGSVSPTITASGTSTTYNAPNAVPASDLSVKLTATSVSDTTKSQAATITVPAITVSLIPTSANVVINTTALFTPTVNNDSFGNGVTWALSQNGTACSPGCGTVSPTSTGTNVATTYTAPTTLPATNMTVTLTATSVTDATKSFAATIVVPSVEVVVSPASPTVPGNGTAQLTANVAGDSSNKGVAWTVSCGVPTCGGVSPASSASGTAVTYTAPAPPATDLPVIVTATSVANTFAAASATVTVSTITLSIEPSNPTVVAGTTQQLTATVSSDLANKGVTWTVACSSASCGSVLPTSTASGDATTYTAPTTAPASDITVSVTATSVTDTTKSSTATVTVPAIGVSVISPATGIIPINATQSFSATVKNDATNGGLNWTLTQNGTSCSPACGTISPASTASGVATTYTAPATLPANATVTLNAISATDATKSSNATITLTGGTVKLIPARLAFSCKFRPSPPGCTTSIQPQATTLTNTGTSALSIDSISITTTGGTPVFAQTNDCASSVAAGASCTITVTFKPTATGTSNASLSISDSSSDSPQQVALSGSAHQIRRADAAAVRSDLAVTTSAAVPAPTGPETVGTRILHLTDFTRDDPYLTNGTKRELAVRLWYPASLKPDQKCQRAAYTSPAVWSYFAELVGVRPFPVATNSCSEAPVADGLYPVVVFTPGYTTAFTDYTFLMEDLASHGYVVASVAHTYETTAVDLADGRLAKSMIGSHLGGPLPADGKSLTTAVSTRLMDLKFVVSELERSNVQRDSPLRGKLDLSKIAVAGHSVGGLTALLAIEIEPRFKAAVMMDGFVPAALPSGTTKPLLILAAGRERWEPAECRLWSNLKGPRLAVNLRGTEHLAMGDWIWLTRDSVQTGPMGPQETMSAIRNYITAFLDANLGSRTLDRTREQLLKGLSPDYPDAVVTTEQQYLCRQP